MSAPEQVPAFEAGKLRVYAIDGADAQGRALIEAFEEPGPMPGPFAGPVAAEALGAAKIDGQRLSLVQTEAFRTVGLASYFADGHDVPADQLAAQAATLAGAAGALLVVPSSAFRGEAQAIAPGPVLRPLATFEIPLTTAPAPPLASPAATGRAAPAEPEPAAKPPSKRGLSPGLVLGLLLIAGVIVALFALIAGAAG